jgi:hypothetical protein
MYCFKIPATSEDSTAGMVEKSSTKPSEVRRFEGKWCRTSVNFLNELQD